MSQQPPLVEFGMDERRHIDILVRANRQLLEQIHEMRQAGNALIPWLEAIEDPRINFVALGQSIGQWREACSQMKEHQTNTTQPPACPLPWSS